MSDNSDFIYAIHSDSEKPTLDWQHSRFNSFQRWRSATTFTATDGLAGNDVKVIIDARGGGLWIGTYGGLSLFKDGKLTSWTENEGLPSRTGVRFTKTAKARSGSAVTTAGLPDSRTENSPLQYENGLPNDGAFQILEDDNRHFWISSNRGIYAFNKDELTSLPTDDARM